MTDGPTRPDELVAAYILDGVDRQSDPDALYAIADYARARAAHLEDVAGRDVDADQVVGDGEELVDVENGGGKGTIVLKKVSCGKSTCSTCPHGPYRYRAYRDGDTVKTEYLGKAAADEADG